MLKDILLVVSGFVTGSALTYIYGSIVKAKLSADLTDIQARVSSLEVKLAAAVTSVKL
jgi:hypothetical protein